MDIIYIIALGWFITEFEPFHLFLDWFKQKLPSHPITEYLIGAFTCWQCATFWSGLILFGFWTAILASLGSLILETWLEKK